MPSDYTGDPAGTQSPAPAALPENAPITRIPSDGDAANAASVAQPFKVLADYQAAAKKPSALGDGVTGSVRRFFDSHGYTRALVDHWGLPGGRIYRWDEDWSTLDTLNQTGATGGAVNLNNSRWQIVIDTDGQIQLSDAATSYGANAGNKTASIGLIATNTLNACTTLTGRRSQIVHTADMALAYQWTQIIGAASGGLALVEMFSGLTNTTNPGAGALSGLSVTGVGFIKRTGDTNWFRYYKGSGAANYVDTGIAVGLTEARRFRIEVVGASAGDAASATILWYIDDTLVDQVTGQSPLVGGGVVPFFRNFRAATGASANLVVGQNAIRANLYQDARH